MTPDEVQKRLAEITVEAEILDNAVEAKEKLWDWTKPYDEYREYLKPERKQLNALYRERRMIMPYELSEIPDYGDVMSLKTFLSCVKDGGFIDYDGFGHYIKDGQETNIEIYPSDYHHNSIRYEFDTIVWYNR
jgi:hypothetical protein